MPVHDWTRVEAGIFHDFHTVWIGGIQTALNGGLLPKGYYALAEQHAGRFITDVLTLHAGDVPPPQRPTLPPITGGILVADAPPKSHRKVSLEPVDRTHRRTLAIRHVSGHQLVALLEVVSPSNKDRPESVEEFATKAASALNHGVHLLLVDLFPPGPHDPRGMHDVALRVNDAEEPYGLPETTPLTLASYTAGPRIDIHLVHFAVGTALEEMPLFLSRERYVKVPLEATYQAAYAGMPEFWRGVLEGM